MGRYEATKANSSTVSVEHVLLGLMRSEPELALRVFKSPEKVRQVRDEIAVEATADAKDSETSSVDLPLGRHCKRVIAYAAAEAENLRHTHISPEHLLLGILRENTSLSAQVMQTSGVTIAELETQANRTYERAGGAASRDGLRNLTTDALAASTQALIGRQNELAQMIQILCRRNRNSPILIGEPGVGKDALVRGLAQRIANEDVPSELSGRSILQVDPADLIRAFDPALAAKSPMLQRLFDLSGSGGPILYVRGIFEQRQQLRLLADKLERGPLQIIASTTPLAYRLAVDRNDELATRCEAVMVCPPNEEETVEILNSAKETFETFHGVVFSAEAVHLAVTTASRFLRSRTLPDSALDLLDDAAARVKLRRDAMPPKVAQLRSRLRRITQQKDYEILQRNGELAGKLAEEQQREQEQLDNLLAEVNARRKSKVVTEEDVLEAVADRTSLGVESIRAALLNPLPTDRLAAIQTELSAGIPVARRDWIEGLLAYLTDCSEEDADQLRQRIGAAKARIAQAR